MGSWGLVTRRQGVTPPIFNAIPEGGGQEPLPPWPDGLRQVDVEKYPKAGFVSTGWQGHANGQATLKGRLTLRGVPQDLVIDVYQVGAGKDPWGGFRRGFEGSTTRGLSDYKKKEGHSLGLAAEDVQFGLSIEEVRQ